MEPDSLVIVDQQPAPSADFPALLKTLHHEFALDAYTCRQRLLGHAQALLCKGGREQMQKISVCLHAYGIRNYCFPPTVPKFSPLLLSHIDIKVDSLDLWGKEKKLSIPSGSTTLILLADISGKLVERQLSQLLSAHRFRGTTRLGDLKENQWQKSILQGQPVLDIYLLDPQGFPQAGVRALPGKFDHRGLGEQATLSSRQNLLKLAERVSSLAPASRLDMRFGLSLLPGAGLHPAAADHPDILKKNLRNLVVYAWLQADIDRIAASAQTAPEKETTPADAATVLLTALNPELALHQQPLMDELASQLKAEPAEAETASADNAVDLSPSLPAPPPLQRHNLWSSPRALIGLGVFGTFLLTSFLGAGNPRFARLLGMALETGLASGLCAVLSFWAGFKSLHLKRLVENTPTSKIRSLAMGLVEIKGSARRQFALYSPMTNIACVYYRLTRYKRNQKNQWVVSSITSSGHVPFWVEDETGRVSVDPSGAKIQVSQSQDSLSTSGTALGGFITDDEKWREELIYDGALIYVLGKARVKTNPMTRQQRRAAALRVLKQDSVKMRAFDRDGDGKIDAEEWQAARDSIEQQLHHEDLDASDRRKRQEDQIVIGRDEHGTMPFVIAETTTEVHLRSKYAIYAGLFLGFAILASVLTLWLVIQ